jgi:hypothetical protein
VLDEHNQYNTLHLRVIIGTNPKLAINHVSEFIPDQKTIEDRDNINTTTEIIRLSPFRVSDSLLNYLRSVLQSNYNGADSEFIMISSPRVIEYELLVLDFGIDLLQHYGKETLYKRSTLEQDLKKQETAPFDYCAYTIRKYNIEMKKIHQRHMKLLKVMREILNRIQLGASFSDACFKRVEGVEDGDSEEEMFKRRMGLRQYFKELKMNIERIKKSKDNKAGIRNTEKKEKKATKKPKEESKAEATPSKSALGASPAEKEKKPKTTA